MKLGDICQKISSGKAKACENGVYTLYGSTGILGTTDKCELSGKYILVARVGAYAGQVNLRHGSFGVSDNTLIIYHNSNVIPEYLSEYLKYYDLTRLQSGSGQPLVTGGRLKEVDVILPSIEQQTLIANLLTMYDDVIDTVNKEKEDYEKIKTQIMNMIFA